VQDILARAGVDWDTLPIKGEQVAGLDSQVRYAKGGELADSWVGQIWHSEQAGVEHDRVLVRVPSWPQDIGVEYIAGRGERGRSRGRLVPGLEGLDHPVRQRGWLDDEDWSQLA
jgi:hypothetical protein